jgi:hypothetical protein
MSGASAAALVAERKRCDALHVEYNQCLNKSGRNPSKCSGLEGDLRKCAVSIGHSYCIDETIALMNCARSPNDTSLCANQFVAMRECNRPRGQQIVQNEKGVYYVLDSASKNEFKDNASQLLSQSVPPAEKSAEGLKKAAKEYASTVGISDIADIRF